MRNNIFNKSYFFTKNLYCRNFTSVSKIRLSYNVLEPKENQENQPLPVIFAHGLLGAKTNWNSVAKAILKNTNRKVVTFDARNHGESEHTNSMSYLDMANDIGDLATTLKINKFTLLGHSMGGRAAMTFALKYPDMLEKLVIVDVSPLNLDSRDFSNMKSYLDALISIDMGKNSKLSLSEARKIADEQLKSVTNDFLLRAFLLTNLAKKEDTFYWKPNLPVLLSFLEEIGTFPKEFNEKKCSVSTLFIRGEHSNYIPEHTFPKIKEMFTNSNLVTIQKAGHWVHAENPSEFISVLNSYLN